MREDEQVTVKVRFLDPEARIPTRAREGDAAFDLYSIAETCLAPGGYNVVPTGISIEIPAGYEGEVRPRSGLAAEHGVTVLNSPGTIDSGYRGEVKVILLNLGDKEFLVTKGMRIGQLAIRAVPKTRFVESDVLSETDRGEDGFGSTGTH
ncbi:MAG: dUTP diphosphatase [Candidatus Thorarchaeota archaeon]|nr:dUTP diphosphatase [Candidatus Thorarchaeota archaeon]